jgi:hypothetical protein
VADIKSITEVAAELYRGGMKLPIAVGQALDQYRITGFEREVFYRAICSELGKRGNLKKQKMKRDRAQKGPQQMSFRFPGA